MEAWKLLAELGCWLLAVVSTVMLICSLVRELQMTTDYIYNIEKETKHMFLWLTVLGSSTGSLLFLFH